MATYTDLDQEQVIEADKHYQFKANTLGSRGKVFEEPFEAFNSFNKRDVIMETPSATTGFASPDYKDDPDVGGIGTRYIQVRLHPFVASGINGNDTIQTFVAISSVPASDSSPDIDTVRMKHLIPPANSPGRATAAEEDTDLRGFEMALYPAKSVGGVLQAYTANGPIPTTADPSAEYGIGGSARWSVDYANGIVRLSGAPLNGPTGLFNPNDVYGDINGNEISAAAGGRITLFATFYLYTGSVIETTSVVVGDGINSNGNYNGTTHSTLQSAINSLGVYGGVVFLREGSYTFGTEVTVPENVKIEGWGNPQITKPKHAPAFVLYGYNSGVSGVEILVDDSSSRACIELITDEERSESNGISYTVRDIEIKNNILHAGTVSDIASSIAFASGIDNSVFRNILIENNKFVSTAGNNPKYITEITGRANDGDAYGWFSGVLSDVHIKGNNFGDINGDAVYFGGSSINRIEYSTITDGYASGQLDVNLDLIDGYVGGLKITNNFMPASFVSVGSDASGSSNLDEIIVEGNNFYNLSVGLGSITDSFFTGNKIGYSFVLVGSSNRVVFSGNQVITATLTGAVSNSTIDNNIFCDTVSFSSTLTDSVFGNNTLSSSLTITGAISKSSIVANKITALSTFSGAISNSVVGGNVFTGAVSFGSTIENSTFGDNSLGASLSVVGAIAFLSVAGNFITTTSTFSDTVSNSVINSNIFTGAVSFGSTFGATTFCNNEMYGTLAFVGAITYSTIMSNIITSTTTFSDMIYLTVINSNFFYGNVSCASSFLASQINNNSLMAMDLTVVGVTTASSIVGNIMDDFTLTDAVSDATINDNIFSGIVSFGSTLANSIFSGNDLSTKSFSATGAISNSSITNNRVATTTTFSGMVSNTALDGNIFTGAVSFLNEASELGICSNNFIGNVGFNLETHYCALSNNIFSGTVSFTGGLLNSSVIGNSFKSWFIADNTVEETVINGNTLDGYVWFDDIINNSTINNNAFGSTVKTQRDITSVSFCNNYLGGAVNFGTDEDLLDVNFTNFVVNGNVGSGSIDFDAYGGSLTSVDTSSNMITGGLTGWYKTPEWQRIRSAITWDTNTVAASDFSDIKGMTYGGGIFVGVGADTTDPAILWSGDGAFWTANDAADIAKDLYAVAYSETLERFVAVGQYDGVDRPIIQYCNYADVLADGGWTSATAGAPATGGSVGLNGVAFGQGLFVAVGDHAIEDYPHIITSPDGITWETETDIQVGYSSLHAYHVMFQGGATGMFIACCGQGDIIYSYDGKTWRECTMPALGGRTIQYSCSAYGNGIFVAVGWVVDGDYRVPLVSSSSDGITWTERTLPAAYSTAASANAELKSVVYGNGVFICAGEDADGAPTMVFYSTDGITWNYVFHRKLGATTINWMAYGDGLFIAQGNGDESFTSEWCPEL